MKKKDKKLISWKEMSKINYRALKLIFKCYPQMVISRFMLVIWNALTPYVGIYLVALIINELADSNRSVDRLMFLVIITLAVATVISLIKAILNKWETVKNAGIWMKIENIFSQKLFEMDYSKLDDTKTSELLSTIRQNQNSGGWGLYSVIPNYETAISSILTLLGGISLTVTLFVSRVPDSAGGYTILNNPLIVITVIVLMLIITYLSPVLSNKAGSYYALNADSHNEGNRLFSFFGFLGYEKDIATDIRIYCQDKLCEKYNTNKEGTFGSKGFFAKLSKGPIGIYNALSAAVSVIFTGIVYVFVCLKAWAGAFSLGSVTLYISSITRLAGGFSQLIAAIGNMRNNASFLKQVFTFLDIPNDLHQGELLIERKDNIDYEIEFCNVSFKYPGSENYALKNINMKFKVGKSLAVVGVNGSGKTTFIKLLCRLYDPTEGQIRLNGIDIKNFNYLDYMMVFSVVFQDFRLFSLKLSENVASNNNYDPDKVENCLLKAGFSDRLKTLTQGIDTYLYKDYDENGVNISGGEAQKIAIARALYKDAPFIILDEPTAALDPIAEAEIYSKFDEIAGGKTTIYISHRLSSCKFCDEIIVFNEGKIIQKGIHSDLLVDKKGKYYELWNAQAQYYTDK